MNRNSGKYLDLDNNKTDNNTAIVQFDDEGVDASQTWTFTEVMKGKGVYSICSYGNKNRGMDVVDFLRITELRCNYTTIWVILINSLFSMTVVKAIINL